MEGALSFARSALACKEDTKLLALCTQVITRLKELSQLKWDSQSTEKIEMTTIKQPQMIETGTAVGEIETKISTLDVQITSNKLNVPLSNGCSTTFHLTASVNFKWKTFKWKTPKLTASATYRPSHGCDQVTTEANVDTNSWTLSFTPPRQLSTYTITFQVDGEYGGTDLHKASDYRIGVYNALFNDNDSDDSDNWM